jgi:hypothetical protein
MRHTAPKAEAQGHLHVSRISKLLIILWVMLVHAVVLLNIARLEYLWGRRLSSPGLF